MKMLICGKGGSGKSTICAMLALHLRSMGYRILLVDADESNFGLHCLVGMPKPIPIMDSLGGKKEFKNKINSPFPSQDTPFQNKMTIDELNEPYVTKTDGIRLTAIGKIQAFGEGCACAMGLLSKTVLSKLILGPKDLIIIDTEAGIEHFGRRVDAECNLIIGVIDPTHESFLMARTMTEMAREAVIDICFVLNKVNERTLGIMLGHVDSNTVIAHIPNNDQLFMDSLEGKPISVRIPQLEPLCKLIEKKQLACRK